MKGLCTLFCNDTRAAHFAFAVIAAGALAAAYTAQYGYGLAPCELCLYQRAPYYAVIAFAILGIVQHNKPHMGKVFLGFTALAFAINAAIAFYHTGVERKWWPSFLEACTIPEIKGNITDVLAQIEATPAVRCDEIPWTDPWFGLSMANYNVIICLILAIAAACMLSSNACFKSK